jgi:hypothetical protein
MNEDALQEMRQDGLSMISIAESQGMAADLLKLWLITGKNNWMHWWKKVKSQQNGLKN